MHFICERENSAGHYLKYDSFFLIVSAMLFPGRCTENLYNPYNAISKFYVARCSQKAQTSVDPLICTSTNN